MGKVPRREQPEPPATLVWQAGAAWPEEGLSPRESQPGAAEREGRCEQQRSLQAGAAGT